MKSVPNLADKGADADPDVGLSRLFTGSTTLRFWSYSNYSRAPISVVARILEAAGSRNPWEIEMGKYLLAWVLGVPAIVLVIVYVFFH